MTGKPVGARGAWPAGWLIPDWPAAANVRALCTTRYGGISTGPWNSMNLGARCGDDPLAVAVNRRALQSAIGARPVFLNQVHGIAVLEAHSGTADGQSADASITVDRNVACTVLAADCLPVLLADTAGQCVGAAHAGWRGLAVGVLSESLERFRDDALVQRSCKATNIVAWMGPCIGPLEFEVGSEVKGAFEARDPAAGTLFAACGHGKWRADLAGLARLQLLSAGVHAVYGNDGSTGWCTVRNPSRFFSHRRDTSRLGGSGRFAACIWLE